VSFREPHTARQYPESKNCHFDERSVRGEIPIPPTDEISHLQKARVRNDKRKSSQGMKLLRVAGLGLLTVVGVSLFWRWLSRRRALPCPTWVAGMLEWEGTRAGTFSPIILSKHNCGHLDAKRSKIETCSSFFDWQIFRFDPLRAPAYNRVY
jgi:hypothetical protein